MENEEDVQEQDHHTEIYIPERCCPERIPSPQLPSPEDCLPPDILVALNEKIREANELLLNLALDDNRSIRETYQKAFDGLIGLQVEVTSQLGEVIEGKVTLSGFDFVILRNEETIFIVPHGQIELIKSSGHSAEKDSDKEIVYDPCFRRNLMLHFGEVVSSSPELIQLFFRNSLSTYLLLFEGKRMQVIVEDTKVEGHLADVNKESIILEVAGERTIIPIEKISLIIIQS